MKRYVLLVLIVLSLSFAGIGMVFGDAMKKDVLKVGTESTYPPFEFRDKNNNLVGFDIDLMEAIAKKIGKKLEWVDMPFDSLIPALLAGKIDIIAAGMSATAERAKKVAFSVPYYISLSSFVVRANDNSIKTLNDLKGKTIAVQLGTVQDTFCSAIPNVTMKRFQKFDDCVREVVLGRADATLMDKPVAIEFCESKDFKGKIKIAFDQVITEAGKALALRKEDVKLLEAINKVIEEMRKSGELQALTDKWFKQKQ
ncbi:MAG: transporter substrate-binding domain-containing protein [Synergistetes bacterium]|nr:transporter substrate-binding domain-containing protein [Synergistota bacterium]MCX8127814.1 transporter substrate-binding domain-containing protein [Synergistota bacterium]MDW8192076.1 transporter substrate-binding domain-containing protein [Synergistota bacterium]